MFKIKLFSTVIENIICLIDLKIILYSTYYHVLYRWSSKTTFFYDKLFDQTILPNSFDLIFKSL